MYSLLTNRKGLLLIVNNLSRYSFASVEYNLMTVGIRHILIILLCQNGCNRLSLFVKLNPEQNAVGNHLSRYQSRMSLSIQYNCCMSGIIERTYQKVTQTQHILLRPEMYVGAVSSAEVLLWVLEGQQFVQRKIRYVPALYKIFDEILVNAADNCQRKPAASQIRVDFRGKEVVIRNNGRPIPVQMHRGQKVLVPQLVFGHLLTSSNYSDQLRRTTGGRNGFGAKLTNIFSSNFSIEVADASHHKLLRITWTNNMSLMSQPIIQPYQGDSYTCVRFEPDYRRFGLQGMPVDMLSLLKRRVYDIAGTVRASVYLDGQFIPLNNFSDYAGLYLPSQAQKLIEVKTARWQVLVGRSEGQFQQVSFVNGVCTPRGGTHVAHIVDQIVEKASAALAKKKQTVRAFQVKAQLRIFISCLIDNPSFDSQQKESLTTPAGQFGSMCEVPDEVVKQLMKGGLGDQILGEVRLREQGRIDKQLKKAKKTRLVIPKLDDANEAGRSKECCLILTQGDSAKALALCGIEELGRDYYGVYPLKGKLANVRDLTVRQVMENAQLSNIVKILGLAFQREYQSTQGLRYGSVMIMADQDADGSHIKGLVLNFFETFWPSLCRIRGFLRQFITPVVKCRRGTDTLSFYSLVDYRRWSSINEPGWSIKYYKGLGTSTSREAKQYFRDLQHHQRLFTYGEEEDAAALELAFGRKRADQRKEWLSRYDQDGGLDYCSHEVRVKDFVHLQLVHFSAYDNVRSIPSLIDGLKPSQRKILFSCFKRGLTNEVKVAQLAGYVAEHSAYHHGEASLTATIVGMAQDYLGSNNLNLLQPLGQFGTRYQNGKDAASPRYILTKLGKLTRLLFPEADDHVVEYLIEENQSIQPRYYVPILPLILINGSQGIGTGWSTTIHPHTVEDVIALVRSRFADNVHNIPIGWQRFRGTVVPEGKGYIVRGTVQDDGEWKIIRQIPPTKSIRDYKDFLEQKLASSQNADPQLQEVKQFHRDGKIEFAIKFVEGREPAANELEKYLRLMAVYQENNMHLFTKDGRIKKFDTINDILEQYYNERVDCYQRRKRYLLSKLEKDSALIDNQLRFVRAMLAGHFSKVHGKTDWVNILREQRYAAYQDLSRIFSTKIKQDEEEPSSKDFNYLLNMPVWSFCQEKIDQLYKNQQQLQVAIHYYQSTSLQELWQNDLNEFEQAWMKAQQSNEAFKKEQSNNTKRRRPVDDEKKTEVKMSRPRRTTKKNMMQEELDRVEDIQGRRLKKPAQLPLDLNTEKKKPEPMRQESPPSRVDAWLSKYLGTGEQAELSLQNRVRARLEKGDKSFLDSYKTAKQQLEQLGSGSNGEIQLSQ